MGGACVAGACVCPQGYDLECGAYACVDLDLGAGGCGLCGVSCGQGELCQQDQCVCPADATLCGGDCIRLGVSYYNCGACGNACGANQVCNQGACAGACGAGLTDCGAGCVDLKSDRDNCGACYQRCASGVCANGVCT
jgi:hypothetical protein